MLPVLPIVKKSLDNCHTVYLASDTTTMPTDSQELKNAGLKITLPRLKILELLESSTVHHLSAEDVYKILLTNGEEIGLATVYRVLTQFEAAGLVVRHHFEGGHSVFELSSDSHHDHIVCVKCGRVEEFHDEEIESRQRSVAENLGFELTDHNLNMYGLCRDCQ
ncbi:MAG: Fur family ferric uptake transcriptional regulator [Candidatus Azotimanducaceae bacterium]|jgi:Fur family ferric uptake transcriptional regulator